MPECLMLDFFHFCLTGHQASMLDLNIQAEYSGMATNHLSVILTLPVRVDESRWIPSEL